MPRPCGPKPTPGTSLPGEDDRKRYRPEDATRQIRQLITLIQDLIRESLRDGQDALPGTLAGRQNPVPHNAVRYP